MTATRRRLIVKELCEEFNVSQRRASRAVDLARSSLRYQPVVGDEQAALARRIEELAGTHPRYGYRRIWALLDREGWTVNTKAVRRLYRELGLKVARPRANPKPRRAHGQDENACHPCSCSRLSLLPVSPFLLAASWPSRAGDGRTRTQWRRRRHA